MIEPREPPERRSPNGRSQLVWGLLCLLISLLAVFRAPAYPLWLLSLAVTEWGIVWAMLALVPVLIFRNSAAGRRGALAGILACGCFLSPIVRAVPIARALPEQLRMAFGPTDPPASPQAPARPGPLVYRDLVLGIPVIPVREMQRTFLTDGGDSLDMDIYQPLSPGVTLAPGVMIVHGGSWRGGSTRELNSLSLYLAARGYLVAAPQYRFAPRWHFPAPMDDVRAAIRYLRDHAQELHWDPRRLVLVGRSAGGQIALMVAYQKPDPAIRGVVDFYGPADMNFAYTHPSNPLVINSRALLLDYMGGPPEVFPQGYDTASPVEQVGPATPPTLIIHGALDPLVWPNHARHLAKRLTEAHRPFLYLDLPWATHGLDVNLQGPGGQLSTYAIERFIAAVTTHPDTK